MALAEIPTMSENKARESGIFGFPWFEPCLFSQKRWGTETWPGNIKLTGVIGESPKKISWSSAVGFQRYDNWKITILAVFQVPYLCCPMSELHAIFLVTLLLQLSILYSLAMSRHLTVSEKKDMAETMEIQKCHSGLVFRHGRDFGHGHTWAMTRFESTASKRLFPLHVNKSSSTWRHLARLCAATKSLIEYLQNLVIRETCL